MFWQPRQMASAACHVCWLVSVFKEAVLWRRYICKVGAGPSGESLGRDQGSALLGNQLGLVLCAVAPASRDPQL